MTIAESHMAPTTRPKTEDLIPTVESDIFTGHEEAKFYVGILAVPGAILMPREYEGYSKLRGNVYVDEMRFLEESERSETGAEYDADDERSVHFGVLENRGEDKDPRIVGSSRLILKRSPEDILPVEEHFPEYFTENPAPMFSAEASRYIARYEDRNVQDVIKFGLIRSMTAWLMDNGHKPAFAVVERSLARLFERVKMPYEQVAETKFVDKYNTENMAIVIDPTRVIDSVRPENDVKKVSSDIMRLFFQDTMEHKGLGHFDGLLLGRK